MSAKNRLAELMAKRKGAETENESGNLASPSTGIAGTESGSSNVSEPEQPETSADQAGTALDSGTEQVTAVATQQSRPSPDAPVTESLSADEWITDDHEEAEQLRMKMAELEQAMLEELPEMRVVLRDIHVKLRKDPAIVTAFTDEGIGLVVQALTKMANVEIVKPAKVKAAKKSVKNLQISADDL
tara:strand:- start:32366 stop:32923 length:558 start_codon:yes stop_codon:yes gene_type:complete